MTVLLRQIHNNLICACVLIILFLIGTGGGGGGGGNNGADLYVLHLCTKFSDE